MEKVSLAAIATITAGGLIAIQPPVVARLADATGTLPAAAINFVVGAGVLVLLALVVGDGSFSGARDVSWFYVLGGGIVGALYITTVVLTIAHLGAAGVVAATIAGQLTVSVIIDRLGVLGLEETAVTPQRVLGIGLLLAGTILVVR